MKEKKAKEKLEFLIRCPYCGYKWKKRVDFPKRCPRCQRWLPPWKPLREI